MKKYKKLLIILSILAILIVLTINIKKVGIFAKVRENVKSNEETNLTIDDFSIKDNENNFVNLIFSRANGINKIKYPTGFEITCNGRKKVSIDFEVDPNQEYIFKLVDSTGKETEIGRAHV